MVGSVAVHQGRRDGQGHPFPKYPYTRAHVRACKRGLLKAVPTRPYPSLEAQIALLAASDETRASLTGTTSARPGAFGEVGR